MEGDDHISLLVGAESLRASPVEAAHDLRCRVSVVVILPGGDDADVRLEGDGLLVQMSRSVLGILPQPSFWLALPALVALAMVPMLAVAVLLGRGSRPNRH